MSSKFAKLSREVKYLNVIADFKKFDVSFCEWDWTRPLQIKLKSKYDFELKVN